uniref:Uncharacterized protein n=1 Tax=Leersia perrieri TaxID=77586 RepID=A0A0D9WDR9_9ORYZ
MNCFHFDFIEITPTSSRRLFGDGGDDSDGAQGCGLRCARGLRARGPGGEFARAVSENRNARFPGGGGSRDRAT